MGHTPRRRDLYRAAIATLTGLAALGSLVGTGYAAGAIAHQQERDHDDGQDERASTAATPPPPAPAPRVVMKRRPHRTVVRTQVVHQVSTPDIRVGTGGAVTTSPSTTSGGYSGSSGSGSSGGGGHQPVRHSAPVPAPAPAPKPAPSAGS